MYSGSLAPCQIDRSSSMRLNAHFNNFFQLSLPQQPIPRFCRTSIRVPPAPVGQSPTVSAWDFKLEEFNTIAQPSDALRSFVTTSIEATGQAQHRPSLLCLFRQLLMPPLFARLLLSGLIPDQQLRPSGFSLSPIATRTRPFIKTPSSWLFWSLG